MEKRQPSLFYEDNLDKFRQIVNSYAENDALEEPLTDDIVIAGIDLHVHTHGFEEQALDDAERVVHLMEGGTVSELDQLASVTRAVFNVAKTMAQNVNDFKELPSESVPFFMRERSEALRGKINNYAREPVFNDPLTDEEVWKLVDLYTRTHSKQHIVVTQKNKLVALLQGRRISDIAKEYGVERHTISDMWSKALSRIAFELNKELSEIAEQDLVVNILLQGMELNESQTNLFKRHLTEEAYSHMTLHETLLNTKICDVVREKMESHLNFVKMIDATSLPASQDISVVRKLLGTRRDGVEPTSRSQLLEQYRTQLQLKYQTSPHAERTIAQKEREYNESISEALRHIALWMDSSDDVDAY